MQKKTIKNDLPNSPSFFPKIGISVGSCKFIILKGIDGKYEYAVIGDALLNAFHCAEYSNRKGQIITTTNMFDNIYSFFDYSSIEEDNRYICINGIKNTDPLLQNNKSIVNIIMNNFTLEQIIRKRDILSKFNIANILGINVENTITKKELLFETIINCKPSDE